MGTSVKRLAKVLTYALVTIVCLVLLTLLLLRTHWVKRYLLDLGLEKANAMLNGRLTVGDISGSLFGQLELSDITLVRENDTICTIELLKFGYQLSPLFDQQLKVDSVIIDSVSFSITQYADSTWNVAGLMKADTTVVIDSAATDQPFGYTLLLDNFMLRRAGLRLTALDTALHLRFEDILIHLAASYADTAVHLHLDELQLQLADPMLRLERLALDASQRDELLTISNLVIETKRNELGATANYLGADSVTASGNLTSRNFDFREFTTIVPELNIAVRPQIALTGHLAKDSLYAGITLSDSAQVVDLNLALHPMSFLLSEETHDSVGYRLQGRLANLDVAQWTGDTSLAFLVNGLFALHGIGLTPEKMKTSLTTDFGHCRILDYPLDTASLEVSLNQGRLNGTAALASSIGDISLDSLSADLFGSQTYSLNATVHALDLAPLLNNDSLESDLNFSLQVDGQGFDTSNATAAMILKASPSKMYDVTLAGGLVRASYAPTLIEIDTFSLQSDIFELDAGGTLSDAKNAVIDFRASLPDLTDLHSFAGTDSLGGSASVNGTLSGRLDSLVVSGQLSGQKLWYQTTALESVSSRFSLALVHSAVLGRADLRANNILASGFAVDSLIGSAVLERERISSALHLATPEGLLVSAAFELPHDSLISLIVKSLTVDYQNQHWTGGGEDTRIRLIDDAYLIDQFVLVGSADSSGSVQRLSLDGRFSLSGNEDLRLAYDQIALAPLAELTTFDLPLDGRLSGTLHFTGSAAQPQFTGRTLLANGLVQKFGFDSLTLAYSYAAERLSWTGLLDPGLTGQLTTSGYYPLHLSLTDNAEMERPSDPMEIKLAANQLPFAVLGSVSDEMSISGGLINADVTLGGSWNHPDMAGTLSIDHAAFAMQEIGAEYDNLAMALSFNDNTIILDSLLVARGKGTLHATGKLEFENTLMSGVLHATDFTLVADRIFLARHSNFEIQISGNTNLHGSTSEPTFGGEITIDRSKFYVPFLTEMAAKTSGTLESPPLLMAALYPDSSATDSTAVLMDSVESSTMAAFDYYRNLRGEIALSIPRNTWLKSPEMNIEISGDIRMVKNSPEDFELFGPITVVRGKYIMYGKEFVIREGTLTFTGGAEYNPDLNLIAQYVFRSPEREKHMLVATITGKAFNPQVTFALDGSEVPERDALAYVVFGRSMDEVTASGTGGGSGDMAKGVAANVLAGQLASTLGKSLALDVVEIDASSSLAGATITLGKYLTTDLFMSYQRGVGNPSEDEVTPVIVTLEYELTRNLALQLLQGDPKASGFDFVFKFAW